MSDEWNALNLVVKTWKAAGHKLIFTNGCFDMLHDGHKALLAFAKKQAGKVLVGLNSDDSVTRLKGENRPKYSADIRSKQLLDTNYVDAVVIFNDDTPRALIEMLEPDILIKGDDYGFETTIGAPEVEAKGGKVLFFKKLPGISTSDIINKTEKNIETNQE
jgi:D-beta-D-heptose 7-phosphate kinase/D-beta-D-heptose 1-phosphate adenosyltransferase